MSDASGRGRECTTAALQAWHARRAPEPALEPGLPIVDAHHHLHGTPPAPQYFRREELARALASSGQRVLGTLYCEAYEAGWRRDGPPEWRSLGEVETIAAASAAPLELAHGPCMLAAAIVSHVDLRAGDAVAPILEAHLAAGQGRLRGVRQQALHDPGRLGQGIHNQPAGLLADARLRAGCAWLQRLGLSFDALVFHHQLAEVSALADALPDLTIVLNHLGLPLGVAQYRGHAAEVTALWRAGLRELARRPNVRVKAGGQGMLLFGHGCERQDAPPDAATLARAWQPAFAFCVETFGAGRCMLESNFPVDAQSCGYGELWNACKLMTRQFSPDERAALFYRTACQSYRLPELEAACDRAATA